MIIEKIKLKNFKKFRGEKTITFNKEINVFIGDNEAGKSTILTAIDIVLSGSQGKVDMIGLENIFNVDEINDFLKGDREYNNLPELYIEIYLEDTGNSDLNGEIYSEFENGARDGLKFSCVPNDEYSHEIVEKLKKENPIFHLNIINVVFIHLLKFLIMDIGNI